MSPAIAIGFGGALGALLRYVVAGVVQRLAGSGLPWGTFAVNLGGSFALGFILLASQRMSWPDYLREFAAVGALGAFTTFSALSWELTTMLRDGAWLRAGAYALGSVSLGVLALVLGSFAASALLSGGGS